MELSAGSVPDNMLRSVRLFISICGLSIFLHELHQLHKTPRDKRRMLARRGRSLSCYNCGKPGHLAKNCPDAGTPVCYNCNQSGHLSKECPNETAEKTTSQLINLCFVFTATVWSTSRTQLGQLSFMSKIKCTSAEKCHSKNSCQPYQSCKYFPTTSMSVSERKMISWVSFPIVSQ